MTPDRRAALVALAYTPLDESDPAVAAIVRRARREAATVPRGPSARLVELCDAIDDPTTLTHLRCVVMARHPTEHATATGAGAVWAVATRLINTAAWAAGPPPFMAEP